MKQQYNSYKPSGIDWIGDIPSPWRIVRIKNIISLLTDYDANGSFSDIASNCKINEGIPYAWMVRATDLENKRYGIVEGNNYCDISTYRYLSKSSLVKNDILIAKRGDIGKSYLVPNCDSPMTLAPNTYLLKTLKNLINNHYLFYYLQSSSGKENLRLENKSTTLGALYKDDVKRIPIPLPPLTEQEVIAAWLDEKCGEIDAAIAKVDREIELIDELKQSEISRVVTRGLNPDAPLRSSGIDWIGDIPQHWRCVKIKHLSPVLRGASPRPIDDPKYFNENGEFSWVRIADVTASERYLETTTQRLSTLGASLSVKRYPGDLFLSIAGTVGKPIITRIKCCIHDGFVWFPLLKINPEYLYYIFKTGQPYRGLGKFGTQLNLNTDTVGNIFIPLPPYSEIELIIRYLDKKCAEIDGLKAKLRKKRETLTELRQSLISEVVTGKRKVI